eukprot:jgi/Chlat1/5217/Chrsp33S05183
MGAAHRVRFLVAPAALGLLVLAVVVAVTLVMERQSATMVSVASRRQLVEQGLEGTATRPLSASAAKPLKMFISQSVHKLHTKTQQPPLSAVDPTTNTAQVQQTVQLPSIRSHPATPSTPSRVQKDGVHGALKTAAVPVLSCPVMFTGVQCTKPSERFFQIMRKVAPGFESPFLGDLALTASSIRSKRRLFTSLPGKNSTIELARVTDKLLQALPQHDEAFPLSTYASCAIVGSSGILLNYAHGKEIDAHDVVFRFNSAPTQSFARHSGIRTTHRLTNSRNFAYREYPDEVILVHLRNPTSLRQLQDRRLRRKDRRIYGLNPSFHRYMDRSFHFLSTSGLNGIIMALHKCARVDLYGFHIHPQHGAYYHYYNKNDVAANAGRDDEEWAVVKALVENNFVTFREPCVLECHDVNPDVCKHCLAQAKDDAAAVMPS